MKKIALFAVLASTAGLALAQQEPKSSYSVSVDFPYTSKYVFRGLEAASDSIQPSVEVAVSDFYIGVWTNQPITKNQSNEFDFYAGYKLKLNDSWNIDGGATVYYYPEADLANGGRQNTTEAYLGLNGNIKGFTPGVYAYYDTTLETTTAQLQLGYSLPLASAGLSLDFSANAGRVYANTGTDYNYYSVGLNVPYKLSDKALVYAGVAYSDNNYTEMKGDFVIYTAGITVGF